MQLLQDTVPPSGFVIVMVATLLFPEGTFTFTVNCVGLLMV
jgi:hypothetical protein